MAILNYTTEIPVEKTSVQIHKILVNASARAIMNEYDIAGNLRSISFKLVTEQGQLSFKLPGNIEGITAILQKKYPKTAKEKIKAQAAQVGWRIVKDWIEAQLAIIQSQMATTAQVFLPYVVTSDGRTLYEKFERGGAGALGLTYQPVG